MSGSNPFGKSNDPKRVEVSNKIRKQFGLNELKLEDKKCLYCDKVFESEGPHNRMCSCCRNRSDLKEF